MIQDLSFDHAKEVLSNCPYVEQAIVYGNLPIPVKRADNVIKEK